MTVSGLLSVAGVESSKLAAQLKVRVLLAACVIGPFGFAVAMRVQSSLPVDTLFGRAVKESGFAVSLVVLGFAALWAFPAMSSVVGGDLFSSEDRHGTWKTVLTRSRSRAEVFAGKVLTALAVLLSVATRSSAAGIGLPVAAGLTMQLLAFVDGPEVVRRLLITSAFGAWHGLLTEPRYVGPLVHGTAVSAAYCVVCLTVAYRMLRQRDIGG